MNWDSLQSLEYDKENYHCEHFLIDAYRLLTGIDLSQKLLLSGFFHVKNLRHFKKIDVPHELAIVLLRDTNKAHVGLWHDNKMLHLDMKGVVLQPLEIAKLGFRRVDFYEVI